MFDDVFGMATQCAGNFRAGVRDAFGASIAADVLEPILKELNNHQLKLVGFLLRTESPGYTSAKRRVGRLTPVPS